MLEVRRIENLNEWDDFVKKSEFTLFTQSYLNGYIYENIGENFWIFGVYKNSELVAGSLVVSIHAKRGNFLLMPYGPILKKGSSDQEFKELIKNLKSFAKREQYDFLRISPFMEDKEENNQLFFKNGFRNAPMHVLAENTWIMKLDHPEQEILKAMNKNHRNLIRRCEKSGVKIRMTRSTEALERLNNMHDIVAKRHKFHRFPRKYINNEFEQFSKSGQALIFEALLPDGSIDSSAIIIFYGKMACYRHSASLQLDKKLPTSYLIQWEVIKEAKKRGFKYYNFWGIAPKDAGKNHPFKGITHFKRGFGGFERDLVPCKDLAITGKYKLNWIIEKIRSIRRGFK